MKKDKVEGQKAKRLRKRISELDVLINPKSPPAVEVTANDVLVAGNRVQELLRDEDDWKELLSKQWPPVRKGLNTLADYFGIANLRERD